MLADLRAATGVCADIAMLDLGVRFSAVVLMSHLVNSRDARPNRGTSLAPHRDPHMPLSVHIRHDRAVRRPHG